MRIEVRRQEDGLPHQGIMRAGQHRWPCSLGRGGIVPAARKREGDGASPAGEWPIRHGYYRADRLTLPADLGIALIALNPADGWCDAADDPRYNQPVRHPYRARAEHLWRADGLYDVIIVLGYNDAPIVPGAGSAIFLHCRAADGAATEGCVALERSHLIALLASLKPSSSLIISID